MDPDPNFQAISEPDMDPDPIPVQLQIIFGSSNVFKIVFEI